MTVTKLMWTLFKILVRHGNISVRWESDGTQDYLYPENVHLWYSDYKEKLSVVFSDNCEGDDV